MPDWDRLYTQSTSPNTTTVTLPTTTTLAQPKPIDWESLYANTDVSSNMRNAFLDNVVESFKRGKANVLADIGVYSALEDPTKDLEGALRVQESLRREQALHPVEGSWLEDIIFSNAETTGQMLENIKQAGFAATIGAGVGAAIGGAIGLVIPTIGEEPATIGTGAWIGAKAGAKLFGSEAAALFSYRQGVGNMYTAMLQEGVPHDIAYKTAKIAGIPYALVEMLQIGAITKPFTKAIAGKSLALTGTKAIATRIAKMYGKTLAQEVGEEAVQEIIQIAAEDIAKEAAGQNIEIDKDYLVERSNRVLTITKEAAKGFALLPLPGAAFEAAIGVETDRTAREIQEAARRATEKGEIGLDDIKDPTTRLYFHLRDALINSADAIKQQELIRKKERAARFGEAENIRREIEGTEWKAKAKSVLKGEYHKEFINFNIPYELWEQLDQEIRTSNLNYTDAMRLSDSLEAMYKEGTPMTESNRKLARKLWGDAIANMFGEIAKVTKGRKEGLIDYLALGKATSSSLDMSREFRQNILLIGRPRLWARALLTDWNLLLKDEATARALEVADLTGEHGSLALKSGLRWNAWGPGAGYSTGTERFASRVAGKIPGIKPSERAYAMGGNHLRMMFFSEIANQWKGTGKTAKDYRDLAHVINILTGEGDPKWFGKLGPALNAAFFAPRLLSARIRAFTDLLNPNLSWAARKILFAEVVKFVGINIGILTLLSQVPGVDVEDDPRSTDWGKGRIGDMRIDFWGGYLPLARLVVRLATRKRKTRAGKIIPVEAEDTIVSFLQSKLGPAPAFLLDMLRGQTFYGDYVGLDANSFTEQFYHRMVPFFIQDLVDAIHYQGLTGGAVAAPLAFLGAGVQTYPKSPGAELQIKKDRLAVEQVGRKWDTLGPAVQKLLRYHNPEIDIWERQAQYDRRDHRFLENIEKQREQSRKRIMNSLPDDIQKEFNRLQIPVAGTSRSLSSNWWLNDKRYKEYESLVKKGYGNMLTKLVRQSWWKNVPDPIKVELLTKLMDTIKRVARKKIIAKANINDLQQRIRK